MLVLVEHIERSFSLQINITKDITYIVQWVKDFSMISFLYIYYYTEVNLTRFSYVLHQANSRLLVSIQSYFSVYINQYVSIVLHRANSPLLVSIQRSWAFVEICSDTSLFFTLINYHLKKTCINSHFLVYIRCLYIDKRYNSMYIFNNHFYIDK